MRIKHILFLFSILFYTFYASATNRVSTGMGSWTTPGTWSPSGLPVAGDNITILSGHTITMDGNSGACNSLTIEGTADWAAALTTNVGAGGIIVNTGGDISGIFSGILTTTGGLTINATLTSALVAIVIQTTAGQTISGTGSLASLTVNATTTNNGTITVRTTLGGASTLTQGNSATLVYGGTTAIAPTLDASANDNTVDYNGAGVQTVKTGTYYNLTISNAGVSTLGGVITVNNNLSLTGGTLASGIFQITGNATGLFSVAAGVVLTLGLTTSASTVDFPANFTTGNISLNAASTITYQGNYAQNISTTPAFYGNLTMSTGTALVTKALSSSADITLNGNLTLTNGAGIVTFDVGSQNLSVAGTIAGTGNLTMTGGNLTITGSFTNTGTFTPGSGLVNYNGAGVQTVKSATYQDLTISSAGASTLGGAITVNGNMNVSGGTLATSTFQITGNGTGTFTLAAGVTLFVGLVASATDVAFPTNFTNANIFLNTASTITYQGNNAQTISSTPTYGNLTVNTFSGSKTANGNITVAGNLVVTTPSTLDMSAYTLNLTGTFTSTGGLSFSSGNFNISGTNTNTGTFTAGTGTVNYNGGGAQTVRGVNYNNLTFSGAGVKTLQTASTVGIAGNFVRGAMTVTAGATNTVLFNGGVQNMTGNAATFINLTLANTSVTIGGDITINTTLTFTTGNIITGSNNVILPASGTVSRTSGHVIGNLRKNVATGSNVSRIFEIGTGGDYAPLDITFATVSVAGNLTVSSTAGDHPQIGTSGFTASATVNRYWTMSNTGITFTNYDVTCGFVNSDKDGGLNTSACIIKTYNGSVWGTPVVGTQGANSTQALTLTTPATTNNIDLQIGENIGSPTGALYSIVSGNWTTLGTWSATSGGASCGCFPTNLDNVFIENNFTVTMDGNTGAAKSLTIQTGGTATWASALTTNIGTGGINITATGNINTGAGAGILVNAGNLTLNKVLTSTNVTIQMKSGTGQTLSGTGTLPILDISANTTNNGNITVTTTLSSATASTLTQGSSATLTFGGTTAIIPTLDASTNSNTVDYNGAGVQTVKTGTYYNLTISNAGVSTLGGVITINNNLSVTGGTLASGTFQITGNASGIFTMAAATTLTIGAVASATDVAFPSNFTNANISLSSTSIVTYQGNNAQTISSVPTYGNLTVNTFSGSKAGNGGITIAGNLIVTTPSILDMTSYNLILTGTFTGTGGLSFTTGNFTISGSYTNTGTFTCGTGTVDYNSAVAQTIRGTTYYNLTVSNAGTSTLGAATTVNNNLSVAGGILATSTFQITGNATGKLTVGAGATLNLGGTLAATTNFPTIFTIVNISLDETSTVTYSSAGTQTIKAIDYGTLAISGARTTASVTLETGIIGIKNNTATCFSPTATFTTGGYITTGNTMEFKGTGTQTIPTFTNGGYTNLTSSGIGARTFGATIAIAGTFTPGTNAYTITGSTVNFNGTGTQTIPAFNYNSLTSSSTGDRILSSSGTIGIAGVFTAGTNSYTITGSTTNFNGTGAQTIPVFSYNNLTFSSTGGRTFFASGTINITGDFARGTNALTVTGSTISFNGGIQNMTGNAAAYNNLTIANTSLTINSDITINTILTFTTGNIITGSNNVILPASGTVSRTSGHVVGNLRKNVATGSNVSRIFEIGTGSDYAPLDITFATVSVAGNLTVSSTAGDHPQIGTSGFTASATVNRYWTMSNTGITFTNYDVTCSFVNADKDGGINTNTCIIRTYNGASWASPAVGAQGANSTQATALTTPTTTNSIDLQIGDNPGSPTGALYAIATGNWMTSGTWSATSGGASCGCYPTSADDVYIENNFTVTMNGNAGAAKSLTIQTGGTATWASALTTNIGTGGINITATGNINTGAGAGILVNAGNLTLNKVLTSTNVTIQMKSGTGQTLSGTGTLPILDISATTTNNGTITVITTLSSTIASTLTQGNSAALTYGGTTAVGPTLGASASGNTVDYNGAGVQTVKTGTYYNLTISNAGVSTLGGIITVNNNLSVTGGTLATSTFQITGNATGTLSLSAGTVLTVGGTLAATTNFPTNFTVGNISLNATSTVTYNSLGAQIIKAIDYGSLAISGARTTANITFEVGIIGIRNNTTTCFNPTATFTTGTYIVTGNTIEFKGTGTQTIPTFTNGGYNNLTSSGAGARTLLNGGTISIAGTFTPGTNAYTITGSTVDFNGSGSQNIPALASSNYNILKISNTGVKTLTTSVGVVSDLNISSATLDLSTFTINRTATGGTLTVSSGATLKAGGTSGGVSGSNFPNNYTTNTLNGTVEFYGAGSQTIPAFNYNNLTSSNTGERIFTSSGIIGIAGTFTSGTNPFTVTGSTVNFNGSSQQTISSAFTFDNLSLSNTSGLSLGANVNLTGTLTINAGTFTTTGYDFTLKSTSSRTARIAAIPGNGGAGEPNIAGDIIMQRYTGNGPIDWRFFSSAVSGTTIADWDNEIFTSGFTGADCSPANCATCGSTCNWPSIYWYDETLQGNLDKFGFMPVTNVTDPIIPGRGYWVYLGPNPVTFDVKGTPNKFSQTYSVTYTPSSPPNISDDGWNLITNSYPSAIDWDDANWTRNASVDNAVYIWNSFTGSYAAYVGGFGVNGGSRYIGSQQAFYIKANAAGPSISKAEAVKTASENPGYPFLKMAMSPNTSRYPMAFRDFPIPPNTTTIPNSIKLTAIGNGYEDEIFICFRQGATNDFDSRYDAWKLLNTNPAVCNLSSVMNDTSDYSINNLPPLTSKVTIPIRLRVPVSGKYTIRRDSMLMLTSACLLLEDKATGSMTDLNTAIFYSFSISDTTKAPRFILHVCDSLNSGVSELSVDNSVQALYDNGEVFLSFDLPGKKDVRISVYNMMGERILVQDMKRIQKNKIKLPVSNVAPGVYVAVADMNDAVIARKIIIR